MSLIFPHNPSVAAKHNFAKLLVYGTPEAQGPESLTTAVGFEALKDRREAELGMCHQVKKFTASLTAYTAVLGAPVAGVAGGAYYLLKDYIANPSKVFADLTSKEVYCPLVPESMRSFTECTKEFEVGFINGKNLLLGLAGIGLADRAIKKATGFAPIGSVMSWTAHMASSAVLYAAYKAGEMTTNGYNKQEKESELLKKKANITLFEQTKAVFDNVADDLIAKAENFKNDPRALIKLRSEIERLEDNMGDIAEGLKTLKLGKSEQLQILDKLNTTIRSILDMQFILRHAETEIDHKYNAELMGILSMSEFVGKELPFEVTSLVQEIHANNLGLSHSIKAAVLPMMAGAASVVATGALVSGLALGALYLANPQTALDVKTCLMENTACQSLKKEIAAIAGAGSLAGVFTSSLAYADLDRSYRKATMKSEAIIERDTKAVKQELTSMFNGIAKYLEDQTEILSESEQKVLATNINMKIPQVMFAIESTGVIEDASEITSELEGVLALILAE